MIFSLVKNFWQINLKLIQKGNVNNNENQWHNFINDSALII